MRHGHIDRDNKVRAILFTKYLKHVGKIKWAKMLQREPLSSQPGDQSQVSAFGAVSSSQRRRSSPSRPINQPNLQFSPATYHLNASRPGNPIALLILETIEESKTQVFEGIRTLKQRQARVIDSLEGLSIDLRNTVRSISQIRGSTRERGARRRGCRGRGGRSQSARSRTSLVREHYGEEIEGEFDRDECEDSDDNLFV